jgi:hypothetical protein
MQNTCLSTSFHEDISDTTVGSDVMKLAVCWFRIITFSQKPGLDKLKRATNIER